MKFEFLIKVFSNVKLSNKNTATQFYQGYSKVSTRVMLAQVDAVALHVDGSFHTRLSSWHCTIKRTFFYNCTVHTVVCTGLCIVTFTDLGVTSPESG